MPINVLQLGLWGILLFIFGKKIWMFLATEITYNLDEGTSTSKSKMAFMNDVRGGKVSNKQKNQYFRERWRKTSGTNL